MLRIVDLYLEVPTLDVYGMQDELRYVGLDVNEK
jgi:hypothetical protein